MQFTHEIEQMCCVKKGCNHGPVSYTHLDVYKRQMKAYVVHADQVRVVAVPVSGPE